LLVLVCGEETYRIGAESGQDWQDEQLEIAYVVASDAFAHPRTVMIVPCNADVAAIAVYCSIRPDYFTGVAVS